MLQIGTLIDSKYRILSEIGRGGMSVVYLAMNERANKQWAIKEVRKDGVKDFQVIKQGLEVEIEILKKLRHENLPSIVDVIEDNEIVLIVMDYIEGNPLSRILEEYGAQSQENVIKWAKQLCDVLGYLHTRNPVIIYRDMKPANIMLKHDGNITLIDFGIAREFKEMNSSDTVCLGTRGYAAPEQYAGISHAQTDARTDIYSLGSTLYHLATGYNPGEHPYGMKPVREINPSLSEGLERIIQKCTEQEPENRYQCCEELRYDLDNYEIIDEKHKKTQKKKLKIFITTTIIALIFTIIAIITGLKATNIVSNDYSNKITQAEKATESENKINLYKQAIKIDPKKENAYMGMINSFKLEDNSFTLDQEKLLISEISENKEKLLQDKSTYAEISFEIGKLYWYYYNYGDSKNNQITRMKASIPWFDDAVIYSDKTFKNKTMARVYRDIGEFYRDISINTIEADDAGLYKPFWGNITELMDLVDKNPNESDIVKLELYDLIINAIEQYSTKFKSDGIKKEEMVLMYNNISDKANKIIATTDAISKKKEDLIKLLPNAMNAINVSYST